MSGQGRVIRGPEDLAEGAAWLARAEPRFAPVLEDVGPLPLRLRPPGFAALLDIIVGQQVSTASADAISARLRAGGIVDADTLRRAGDEGLRAAGFSRAKIRYAQALAAAQIDYAALDKLDDPEVERTLCAVPGIGPWTAQIYVMFCMGRADGFAPGDLALQQAARQLFDLPARPTAAGLAAMAEAWAPWRSVAARALFAYYRVMNRREGLG